MNASQLSRSNQAQEPRWLIEALMAQSLIQERELAVVFARYAVVEEVPVGATVIMQNRADSDLILILSGEFTVMIDGSVVARNVAGEAVGEMAVVDPHAPRTASIIATANSTIARISEPEFSALADRFPRLWRRIAQGLCDRLRNANTSASQHRKTVRAA
jgi:CRP/FNR family cyclic AMP-dependent transcriptional regulator